MQTGAEVSELREVFRGAWRSVESLPPGLERDLGMATLRLEAAWSFARLTARHNGGPPDPELELLGGFVAEDDGAEAAEELLRRVTRGLRSGVHAGVLATLAGAAAVGLASSERRMPAILAALVGLVVVLVVAGRVLWFADLAGREPHAHDWRWARTLGRRVDLALAPLLVLETALCGEPPAPFTAVVRRRVVRLVLTTWALVDLGAMLALVGGLAALSG
jgi:hypothetical protein